MSQINMPVSTTVNGKREKIGEVPVYVPEFEEVAAIIEAAEVTDTDDEGLPVFKSNEANWLIGALRAGATANARNKLVPGTIELRPGLKLPTNFAELAEPSVGGGNGEYLAQVQALNGMFKEYAASLGKAAKTTALIVESFRSVKTLGMQPIEVRTKLVPYFENFAGWLEETGAEVTEIQVNYIGKVIETCTEAEEADDFNDL